MAFAYANGTDTKDFKLSSLPEPLRRLVAAGWEVKGGALFAPTRDHSLVPMWSLRELSGQYAPDDMAAKTFVRQVETIAQESYRRSFWAYLQGVARSLDESAAFAALDGWQQKALGEGADPAGGFLVPLDVLTEMEARLAERSLFRRFGRVIQTTRDRVVVPRLEPHQTEGSVYTSGFVGGWVGETPDQAETEPSFGQVAISVKKARAIARVSRDLADDQPSLLDWLVQDGSENLRLVEDLGMLSGSGPLQPAGLLHAEGIPTVDLEGTTANTISNTTTDPGSAPKLLDLAYSLGDQYTGRWIMRRSVEKSIRKLVDAQGRFQFPVETSAAGERLLLGAPVSNSSGVEAEGVDGARVVIFGDLAAGYLLVHRALVSVAILRERYADTDQLGFVLLDRVGGVVVNPDAFRLGTV